MSYEKYKKPLKKFRNKKNHDHSPITGLYAYEIKKLDKSTNLEYVKNWFEIYYSFWSSANKTKFLKDDQTLLLLRNRPKSEHKDIFDLIHKLAENPDDQKPQTTNFSFTSTPNFSATTMFFLAVPAVGLPFLIWFSSLYIWLISMLFAFVVACLNHLAEKHTKIDELKKDNNPLWLFAITFASAIYWSAFITDGSTFCSKQYYTSFEPTIVFESGSYGVEDKMFVKHGSGSNCDPGTFTPLMFFGSLLISFWFFIKTTVLFMGYFFRREK